MNRLVSRVYHLAIADPPAGQEAERRNRAARAEAWHRLGLAIIDPADIHDDWLRQAITNEAERLYGKRGRATEWRTSSPTRKSR